MSNLFETALLGLGGYSAAGALAGGANQVLSGSLSKTLGGMNDNNFNRLKDILSREVGDSAVLLQSNKPNHQRFVGLGALSELVNDHKIPLERARNIDQIVNLQRGNTSTSVGLHEIGHAMKPRTRLGNLLRSDNARMLAQVSNNVSMIPASILAYTLARGEGGLTNPTTLGVAGATAATIAGYAPILAEEIRATRNANNLAKKYNIGKLRGLRRALGTYGIGAVAPALLGLGTGMGIGNR